MNINNTFIKKSLLALLSTVSLGQVLPAVGHQGIQIQLNAAPQQPSINPNLSLKLREAMVENDREGYKKPIDAVVNTLAGGLVGATSGTFFFGTQTIFKALCGAPENWSSKQMAMYTLSTLFAYGSHYITDSIAREKMVSSSISNNQLIYQTSKILSFYYGGQLFGKTCLGWTLNKTKTGYNATKNFCKKANEKRKELYKGFNNSYNPFSEDYKKNKLEKALRDKKYLLKIAKNTGKADKILNNPVLKNVLEENPDILKAIKKDKDLKKAFYEKKTFQKAVKWHDKNELTEKLKNKKTLINIFKNPVKKATLKTNPHFKNILKENPDIKETIEVIENALNHSKQEFSGEIEELKQQVKQISVNKPEAPKAKVQKVKQEVPKKPVQNKQRSLGCRKSPGFKGPVKYFKNIFTW